LLISIRYDNNFPISGKLELRPTKVGENHNGNLVYVFLELPKVCELAIEHSS